MLHAMLVCYLFSHHSLFNIYCEPWNILLDSPFLPSCLHLSASTSSLSHIPHNCSVLTHALLSVRYTVLSKWLYRIGCIYFRLILLLPRSCSLWRPFAFLSTHNIQGRVRFAVHSLRQIEFRLACSHQINTNCDNYATSRVYEVFYVDYIALWEQLV